MIMTKCWNIIKTIAGLEEFIPQYLGVIEQQLLPLFEFMEYPEKIEFDDEVLSIITSFIKKSKQISEVQQMKLNMFETFLNL